MRPQRAITLHFHGRRPGGAQRGVNPDGITRSSAVRPESLLIPWIPCSSLPVRLRLLPCYLSMNPASTGSVTPVM
jgi:hypothetical protein